VCQEWVETHRDELSPVEAEFVAASEKAERQRRQSEVEHERGLREAAETAREAERKRAEEAQARRQEAEAGKRAAEIATERQKLLTIWLIIVAVVAISLVGGVIKALSDASIASALARSNEEKRKAEAQTSESLRLAVLSDAERSYRLDLALLLGVEAIKTKDTYEARNSLLKALQARPGLVSFSHVDLPDISGLAYSPDGKTLIASSRRTGGAVVWDVASGKILGRAVGPAWTRATFSPDGKTVAACDDKGNIVLWNVAHGKWLKPRRLAVNKDSIARVLSVAFSPDGEKLVTGDISGVVSFWNVASGEQQLRPLSLERFKDIYYCVNYNSEGNLLAVGYGKSGVVQWGMASGKQLMGNLPTGGSKVVLSRDGKLLALHHSPTGYYEGSTGSVVLWDVTSGAQLKNSPLDIKEGRVTDLAFSPNGKTLAVSYASRGYHGTGLGGVVLWDVTHGEQLENSPLDLIKGGVGEVAFSPDGKTIAFPYWHGTGVQWALDGANLLTPSPITEIEGNVVSVAFTRDGKSQLLATGYSRDVTLWKLTDGKKTKVASLNKFEGYVVSVAFNPDATCVATGNHEGAVVLWDVASGNRLKSLSLAEHTRVARGLAFSPDGAKLAVVYDGGEVVLWDLADNRRLAVASMGRGKDRFSVAFSPDGTTLAIGYSAATKAKGSGGVVLWKVASDKLSRTASSLEVSEGSVYSVTYSSNGRTLAAGFQAGAGLDGGVVLWNATTRQRLGSPLTMSNARVKSLAFSPDPDEEVLAAGFIEPRGMPGGVVLLPGPGKWKDIAKQIANRDLTWAEWQDYFPDRP
jgi:WD40 repeat protein